MTTGFYEHAFWRKILFVLIILGLLCFIHLNVYFFGMFIGLFVFIILIDRHHIISYDGYALTIETIYLFGLIKRKQEIKISDLQEIRYDNFGLEWGARLLNIFIDIGNRGPYNEMVQWFYKDGEKGKKIIYLNTDKLVPIMEEIKKDWKISVIRYD